MRFRLPALVVLVASPAWAGTWIAQTSGSGEDLNGAHFPVDEQTGFIVGRNGTLLKTTDGGTNWVTKDSGTTTITLRSTWFPLDATDGHFAFSNGRYQRTDDGAETYTGVQNLGAFDVNDIHFIDGSNGWVPVDLSGATGRIFWTANWGTTWNECVDAGAAVNFFSVWFVSTTTGFATGESGTLVKSTDGGVTWILYGSSPTTEDLTAVHFPTSTVGYAVGKTGTILKTSDAGGTWAAQTSGTVENIEDVWFVTADKGYAVGDAATVLYTSDGGTTWAPQFVNTSENFRGLHFPIDEATGWVVGDNGVVFKTTDSEGDQLVLHPTGTGSVNDFATACGVDHWRCVNDQPGDAGTGTPVAHDVAVSVLEDAATNVEMFSLDDGQVPAGSTITSLQVNAYVGKQGGGAAKMARLSYDIGGGRINGTSFEVTGNLQFTQRAFETWSGLTLTPAELDALQIGIEHVSGGAVQVTQMFVVITYDDGSVASTPKIVSWREIDPS